MGAISASSHGLSLPARTRLRMPLADLKLLDRRNFSLEVTMVHQQVYQYWQQVPQIERVEEQHVTHEDCFTLAVLVSTI